MLIGTIIGWIIAGLIVGALARLLVPGRQDIGIAMTIVLGIVGALVAGFVGSLVLGPRLVTDGSQVYAVETAWPGWIMAVIGGTIVLWLSLAIFGGDRKNRLP
jgi:uncharacterized membrane protein YeaQ/YmgE (transglycosylase-associated protein family)